MMERRRENLGNSSQTGTRNDEQIERKPSTTKLETSSNGSSSFYWDFIFSEHAKKNKIICTALVTSRRPPRGMVPKTTQSITCRISAIAEVFLLLSVGSEPGPNVQIPKRKDWQKQECQFLQVFQEGTRPFCLREERTKMIREWERNWN